MWKPQLGRIDAVTRSAGVALLCSVIAQRLSSRQSGIESEILAWILLPIAFRITRRRHTSTAPRPTFPPPLLDKSGPRDPRSQRVSAASLWISALGIAAFCCLKAEVDLVAYFPILTPIYLLVQVFLGYDLPTVSRSIFSLSVNTVWGAALTASFITLTLSNWNLLGCVLSIIPAAAVLLIRVALRYVASTRLHVFKPFDVEDAIFSLSWRVLVVLALVLGAETAVFGFLRSDASAAVTLGVIKALAWYSVIRSTHYSSWQSATTIGTFAITSIQDPFRQTLGAQALSHVIASLLTLSQLTNILPRQATAKSTLWMFILIALVPYLANNVAIIRSQSSLIDHREHPITVLFQNAKESFDNLLRKQSTSHAAAREEYRRRYNMDPPPGFEAWYEFAESHQSLIIDDFDMIHQGISPLWRLSGKEVLGVMKDVQNTHDTDVWHCAFSGQNVRTKCTHPYRTNDRSIPILFDRLFKDLGGVLPDVDFFVNHLDEPRVLIPPLEAELPIRHNLTSTSRGFNLTEMSGRPVWDKLARFCDSQESKRSVLTSHTVNTFGLPFVTDSLATIDLCQHHEYKTMHGLLMSPTSFRLIEGVVPILSVGSLSTMGDILFPSPAYIEPGFRYDGTRDIEWEAKRNNLYWAGSTTGAAANDGQWQHYHRQRFVQLAQNLEGREHSYLRDFHGEPSCMKSSFLNGRLFDVGFTRINQCAAEYCTEQRVYFGAKSWADKDQALQSRLVFDLDGNGISGRYYKLLASKSVPLKQTLLQEWHDERLVAWLHYIPISQSMEELPETVVYLTSSKAGQEMAREIAEQGRDWFSKAFRDVDLAVYTYRLLLELARLQDPRRPAS